MGKVKLTLSVEENLIFRAKQIAQNKKQSLSNIIEQFLTEILTQNQDPIKNTKANSLRGIGRSALSNKTDKEIREEMYKDKYRL